MQQQNIEESNTEYQFLCIQCIQVRQKNPDDQCSKCKNYKDSFTQPLFYDQLNWRAVINCLIPLQIILNQLQKNKQGINLDDHFQRTIIRTFMQYGKDKKLFYFNEKDIVLVPGMALKQILRNQKDSNKENKDNKEIQENKQGEQKIPLIDIIDHIVSVKSPKFENSVLRDHYVSLIKNINKRVKFQRSQKFQHFSQFQIIAAQFLQILRQQLNVERQLLENEGYKEHLQSFQASLKQLENVNNISQIAVKFISMFKGTAYELFNPLVASYNPKKISIMRFYLQLISNEYIQWRERMEEQNRLNELKKNKDQQAIHNLKFVQTDLFRVIMVPIEIWNRAKQIYQKGNLITFNSVTSFSSDIKMLMEGDNFFKPNKFQKGILFKFDKGTIGKKQFLSLKEYFIQFKKRGQYLQQNQQFIDWAIKRSQQQSEDILLSNRIFRVKSVEKHQTYQDSMYVITLELDEDRLLMLENEQYYFQKVIQTQDSTIIPNLQSKMELIKRLREDKQQLIRQAEKIGNFEYSSIEMTPEYLQNIIQRQNNEPIPNLYGQIIQKDKKVEKAIRTFVNESNYKRNKLNNLFEIADPKAKSFENSKSIIKKCQFSIDELKIWKSMYGQ